MRSVKKRHIEKVKVLDFGGFDYQVQIILSNDPQKSVDNRKDIVGDIDWSYYCALHYRLDSTSYLFFDLEPTPGLAAHEAHHAVWAMFKRCRAKFENEVMAYHLEFIVDKIMELAFDLK